MVDQLPEQAESDLTYLVDQKNSDQMIKQYYWRTLGKNDLTHILFFCVMARRDTIVRTRLSRLILLAAIGSPIGRQFPYVNIDWSFSCVLEAISRLISNRWNRVASGTSGRHLVRIWSTLEKIPRHSKKYPRQKGTPLNLLWAICNLLWAFGFDVTVVGYRR